MNKSHAQRIAVLGLIGLGLGIYLCVPNESIQTVARNQTPMKIRTAERASDAPAPETRSLLPLGQEYRPIKGLSWNKDDWLRWVTYTAQFGINRKAEGMETLFTCEAKEFERMGFSPIAYAVIFTKVRDSLRGLYAEIDISELNKTEKAGVPPSGMPKMVASTPNSSTFVFAAHTPRDQDDAEYIKTRGPQLIKSIIESFKANEPESEEARKEIRKVAPILAEAVAAWCMAQPVFKRFGSADLTVTFEDEGSSFFVIESIPGIDGGPSEIRKFFSDTIPAPYNRYLLSR